MRPPIDPTFAYEVITPTRWPPRGSNGRRRRPLRRR